MRIDSIEMYRVCNPIKHPYTTSFGSQNAFNSVVVKMRSGDITGWGESAPWGGPFFSSCYDKGCFNLGKDFIIPKILHQEFDHPDELTEMLKPLRGNEFAKAPFDVALWDIWSRQQGISLKEATRRISPRAILSSEPRTSYLLFPLPMRHRTSSRRSAPRPQASRAL